MKTMKKDTYKLLILAGSLFLTGFLYAEENGIYLPDLTTVVEDNSEVFIPEIKMNLTGDLELPEGTVTDSVIFHEVEVDYEEPVEEPPVKKDLKMEGQVGAGYPGNFNVNFLLNGMTEENPYGLNVVYDTMKNYGGLLQSDGFYDRNLSVSGSKVFQWSEDKNKLILKGSFNDTENGLQKLAEPASYSRAEYDASVSYSGKLPKGFTLSAAAEGNLFNRSIEKTSDSQFKYLAPSFQAKWNYRNVEMGGNVNYSLENGLGNTSHRGYTGSYIQWKNNYVKLFAEAGTVFGNNIGQEKVLVPFKLETVVTVPVKYSEKQISIGLEGGMSSEGKTVHLLEQTCAFSAFESGEESKKLPGEVSDWYGILDLYFPIKSIIGLNVNVEYRKSAFGNGFIQPSYSEEYLLNGLYGFTQVDRQLIASRENISFTLSGLKINAGWISYFDFVPSTENEQEVFVSADYSYKNWDAYGEIDFPIIAQNGCSIPVLDLEAGYKVKDSVRIAVNLKDIVKLMDSSNRPAAGQYAARSGSASILLDFKY